MQRGKFEVTLVGTWERTLTHQWEVSEFRDVFKRYSTDANGEGWTLSFTAHRPATAASYQTRTGTFRFVTEVRGFRSLGNGRRGDKRMKERAAFQLKGILQDTTCRPPKVKVDFARSKTKRTF